MNANDPPDMPPSPAESPSGELVRRVLRGAAYLGVANYAVMALGILKTPILARLVDPNIWGIFGLASAWVSFMGVLRVELPEVVISDPSHNQARLVTQWVFETGTALLAMAVGGLLYALVPGIATLPVWQAIFSLLGIRVIFAATSTSYYVLRRDIRQEHLTRLTLIGSMLAFVAAVAIAYSGYPLLSLLVDAAVPVVVTGAGAWLVVGWRPTLTWDRAVAEDIRAFALTLWSSSLLGKIIWQFDDWLVGTVRGPEALGYYSKAFTLANMPMDMFAGVIGGIALSMYAQSRATGREVLKRAYEMTTWLLVRIIALSSIVMLSAAEEIVAIMLGPKWHPVPLLLRLMFLYVLGRPLFQNNAQLLLAVRHEGQFRTSLIVQAVILIVLGPPAVYLWGAVGVSVAVSVMQIAGFVVSQVYVSRHLELRSLRLYLLPVVMMAVLSPTLYLLGEGVGHGIIVTLALKSLLALAVFAGVTYLFERDRIGGVIDLVLANIRQRQRPPAA
jgi:O-antigen/teichoic acid export membrane protein